MTFHKIFAVSVVAAAMGVSACQTGGDKETIGTLAGAALGGYVGSQIGGGEGRLAAVAGGTLLGAMLGKSIGQSLDEMDRMKMGQATQLAQTAPIGEQILWNNPDSGNSGTVTPVRDGRTAGGDYCREFQQTVTVGGQTEEAYGTACRQPDGAWQIVQ